ncbi:hypothetical protein WN51_07032 [Melipona quadrifasciata]|uniref:Uncharacterized protein n=1 Tax=Melipona quadrifasciata TaxID=166423 RepID=A0A0N0BC00_9HYME|nr:hypothetical protein WN51_07032 [Melipona quadrifasciata]
MSHGVITALMTAEVNGNLNRLELAAIALRVARSVVACFSRCCKLLVSITAYWKHDQLETPGSGNRLRDLFDLHSGLYTTFQREPTNSIESSFRHDPINSKTSMAIDEQLEKRPAANRFSKNLYVPRKPNRGNARDTRNLSVAMIDSEQDGKRGRNAGGFPRLRSFRVYCANRESRGLIERDAEVENSTSVEPPRRDTEDVVALYSRRVEEQFPPKKPITHVRCHVVGETCH